MLLFPNIKYETSTFFVGNKEHASVQLDEFKQSVIENLCGSKIQENFKYLTPSPFDSDLDKDYCPSSDPESLNLKNTSTTSTEIKTKKKIRSPMEWQQNVKKAKVNLENHTLQKVEL